MSQHTHTEGLWSVWLNTNICSVASFKKPCGKEGAAQQGSGRA